MSTRYGFSPDELEKIAKLPREIAALAEKYPSDIVNAAEFWNEPPLPNNYIPSLIEIYYGDEPGPDVLIIDGKLKHYSFCDLDDNTPQIAVLIDDQWVYIQIEGKEILNRLGSAVLPPIFIQPAILLNSILEGKSND